MCSVGILHDAGFGVSIHHVWKHTGLGHKHSSGPEKLMHSFNAYAGPWKLAMQSVQA